MSRVRPIALAALASLLPAVSVPPAVADPVDSAVAALRSGSVYRGAATPRIDPSALPSSLMAGIKIAVLPPGPPDPVTAARRIGAGLDPDRKGLTVVVFEGTAYGAASSARCGAGGALDDAVSQHLDELRTTPDVTATVHDFATALRDLPTASGGCGGENAGAGSSDHGSNDRSSGDGDQGSGHGGLIVFLVLAALVLGGIGLFVTSRRRRRQRELSDARAGVLPYYDRLAADVANIKPGDNAVARQAMADAAERYNSAGAQLAAADSVEKYAIARRTALEGLYASRTARRALGLEPEGTLPPVTEGEGPQLDRPQQVTINGQSFQGYPAYTPGAPYYYGGGYGVPGGWYSFPFWETLLVGSMLGGGLGGWGLGGYGMGYDNGYLTGYEAGEDAADDRSADGAADGGGGDGGWGDSGGGGDWGGDWGGADVGGGDWGGGDFGGGDGGGGNW